MSTRIKTRIKDVDTHVSEPRLDGWGSGELSLCAYCGKPFEPRRRDQKYGNPAIEKHLNWERKEALIRLVAALLTKLGSRARDMLRVARLCVEVAYEAIRKAVYRLGYAYDQKRQAWRTS